MKVTCRCRAWEAGCFKCPTLHIGRVDSWTRWPSPPWPLILVTCSNVAPHVDWRNFFSVPICFFWYRVSTHVLLCHTDSYPVWRNSVGQHLLWSLFLSWSLGGWVLVNITAILEPSLEITSYTCCYTNITEHYEQCLCTKQMNGFCSVQASNWHPCKHIP